ncbi:centrosomal protein of 41 kDa B-like [Xenia sp. Carnegie-2017]|uniref:centrosomal protein of 41 kDa B-like n=1 Tax=Xenia sp. Carnegie-2017 TaxID=2897299 RepID=UPI001F03FDAA|nr:centrosomal protein of 41 kDa B-like [Xenia sp. Carnegie-2017]
MSMTRRAPKKKDDIFSKKVPENPKYKHIKRIVDTGSSITKHMEKWEEIKKSMGMNFKSDISAICYILFFFLRRRILDYKYKKDEIFKRMKVNTFAQLVLQVADVIYMENERDDLSTCGGKLNKNQDDSETVADEEKMNNNVPPLNLPPDETARQKSCSGMDTGRSTLQDLIRGVGEVDLKDQEEQNHDNHVDQLTSRSTQSTILAPDVKSLPYLLLDVRKSDEFEQCHIIGGENEFNLDKRSLTMSSNEWHFYMFVDVDRPV